MLPKEVWVKSCRGSNKGEEDKLSAQAKSHLGVSPKIRIWLNQIGT